MGRYDRYFNITIRREVYEELRKLAEAHGLSVPDFLSLVAKTYDLVGTLSRLTELLGKSQYITGKFPVSQKQPSNMGENAATTTPPSASEQQSKPPVTVAETPTANVGEQKTQTHTFCRKKDTIKYFKAFLDWVDRNYKVVDWWEEGDSYCFETEKPPKS